MSTPIFLFLPIWVVASLPESGSSSVAVSLVHLTRRWTALCRESPPRRAGPRVQIRCREDLQGKEEWFFPPTPVGGESASRPKQKRRLYQPRRRAAAGFFFFLLFFLLSGLRPPVSAGGRGAGRGKEKEKRVRWLPG